MYIICIRVYLYIYIHTYIHVCMFLSVYVCIRTGIHTYTDSFEQISREPKMAWVLRFCLGFRVSGLGESGLVLLGQGENRESSTLGTLS